MQKLLNQAVDLAQSGGGVLVATADSGGVPHMTSVGQAELEEGDRIAIAEWFCPKTLENLAENKSISILIYDPGTKEGHQLTGSVEEIKEIAIMDGFIPGSEAGVPQVERKLIVKVDAVLAYSHGPHSDRPEKEQ